MTNPETASQRKPRPIGQAVSRVLQANTTGSEGLPEGHAVLKTGAIRFRGEMPDMTDKPRTFGLVNLDLAESLQRLIAGEASWPLFLHGDVGSGKTCAGLCLIDCCGGWYLTVPDFLERLILAQKGELTYSSGYKRTLRELWDDVRDVKLLVLDELGGRAKVSDHHFESVKRLMDAREGKPTVYISNLSLTELGKVYDDRIASRLAFGTAVALKGDRRLKKEKTDERTPV